MLLVSYIFALTLTACREEKNNNSSSEEPSSDSFFDTGDILPEESTPAGESLKLLQEASQTPIQLSVSEGIPSNVSLSVPVVSDDPVEQGYAFLETYADLYQIEEPRKFFVPSAVSEDSFGTHIRYRQRYGDYPLFNSGFSIHIKDDVVHMTTGSYVPDLAPPPPVLESYEAYYALSENIDIQQIHKHGEPRLGYYAFRYEGQPVNIRTVWRMMISGFNSNGEAEFWQIDVDAITGELLRKITLAPTCDKDIDVMYAYHEKSDTCWFLSSTDDWFDEDGMLNEYSAATDHNDDGMEAFNMINTTLDRMENQLNMCSYDDDDEQVEAMTHVGSNYSNASANGFCDQLRFGDDWVTLDIVAHEIGHLVDAEHAGLEYEGLSGAVDESFADVLGYLVDGNWLIGENLPNGPIRDMSNPSAFGDPDHVLPAKSNDGVGLRDYNSSIDYGYVHTNSGIMNKAAYLIIEGGEHNGFFISGIGRRKGGYLYNRVHTHGLECDDNFSDTRNALYSTARSFSTKDLRTLKKVIYVM